VQVLPATVVPRLPGLTCGGCGRHITSMGIRIALKSCVHSSCQVSLSGQWSVLCRSWQSSAIRVVIDASCHSGPMALPLLSSSTAPPRAASAVQMGATPVFAWRGIGEGEESYRLPVHRLQ